MTYREGDSAISVIMVTYYTGPVLARSIAAARAQAGVRDVVIVDNGNWDGAVAAAIGDDDAGAPVTVIAGHGNIGFAAACNLGARAAAGELFLFINPDAILPPGAAVRLAADGASAGGQWVIGAKLVDPDGAEQQGSRRATLTPWRAFVEATMLYRLAPRHPYFRRFNLHGDPCPTDVTPMPVISGACFMTPREDYLSIGGMDEQYFLHVEDVDFCLRFANAGGRVYFDPHVSVMHFKSSSRVNPVRVDMRKTSSVLRYFKAHFSDPYPAPFLWLVAAVLWASFAVKAAATYTGRAFSVFGRITRRGAPVLRRVRAFSGRRKNR